MACNFWNRGVVVEVRLEGEAVPVDSLKLVMRDSVYVVPMDDLGRGKVTVEKGAGHGKLHYMNCAVPVYVGKDDFQAVLNVCNGRLKPSFSGKGTRINYAVNRE